MMRNLISKLAIGTMVAGAALAVSACGDKTTENTTVDNTMMSDMNTVDEGSTNDMTAIDATQGSDANMAMDMNGSDNMSTSNSTDMAGNGM